MKKITELIRESCSKVVKESKQVKINDKKLAELAEQMKDSSKFQNVLWRDYSCHYFDESDPEGVIDYIFILDTLNFCFWPAPKPYEYDNLAGNIKKLIQNDKSALKPKNLLKYDLKSFNDAFFDGQEFPMIEERFRLFQDTCHKCIQYFDGEFSNILKKANKSAESMLELITGHFRGFQDHCVFNGYQTFFYKRAQILVADVHSAFNGKGIGEFEDIKSLTMFADYRVPQILYHFGALEYGAELKEKIDKKEVIVHGSIEETEIRANTVIAVEMLRDELSKLGVELTSIQVDHILWQKGEAERFDIFPHHRTLTIFY